MTLSRSPRRRRAVWATATAAATALTVLTGMSPAAAQPEPGPSAAARAKVDSAVLDAVGAGKESTFFVVLKQRADLAAAPAPRTHEARAQRAFTTLRKQATTAQASLRAHLDRAKVGYEAYWIANALKVSGDAALVEELSQRDDVAAVRAERHYAVDEPVEPASAEAEGPEWGVKDIKADQVWSAYDDRGEGIVVANVDSGVQFDHPALKANYRGSLGDGSVSHDYNWYDPTGQCTGGAPCDNNGHGTHTMGTMAGAGGIGVAPGAKWIAVKGCEARQCSDSSLLKAGQWILAPTDHNGQNPRPDLAPDIVNNSWGGGHTTFYQDIVEAWNAAGIFEAFSAGNRGDGKTCSTAEAPGTQAPAYGVGAYDASGRIAGFSGFGPSRVDGSMKPNIAAPGVDVRSAAPGSQYQLMSGTSMASPHVAGAVALLWASSPSLIGNIEATRALLNNSARDVDDTHCGGTADANNVWGEGKLDVLATVAAAPRDAATVTGTVTDRATAKPLSGVTVRAQAGEARRTVTTGADGTYRLTLTPGTYTLSTGVYGYRTVTGTGVTVTSGQQVQRDTALEPVPVHAVTGTVLDVAGKPLPGATVAFRDAPVTAVVTDARGAFRFASVAEGSFTLAATPPAPVRCNGSYATTVVVDGQESVRAQLPPRTDASGNTCTPVVYDWLAGTTKVALTGDENARTVQLPFPVSLYGVQYTAAHVTSNGLINFLEPRLGDYANTALPSPGKPNGVVAAFWDDLVLDKQSAVRTGLSGPEGKRRFAVVWENAALSAAPSTRLTFEAVFEEATGAVVLQYRSLGTSAAGKGAKATVGIENQAGTDALAYSFDESVLSERSAIRISPRTVASPRSAASPRPTTSPEGVR
ncbi:S8 family serine peptidase [Streptomyces sp. NPDC087440]|uniref:S8 family serine peptidase n=1 Tax=Streptomyces sp. NPDC087440 TaxID=3365790 RepID=UPI003823AF76